MEKCLVYTISNKEYLQTRGVGLTNLIKGWLKEKGYDIVVYDMILGDFANIILDYSFEENVDIKRLKDLTEQIFKRFNIDYELEEEN